MADEVNDITMAPQQYGSTSVDEGGNIPQTGTATDEQANNYMQGVENMNATNTTTPASPTSAPNVQNLPIAPQAAQNLRQQTPFTPAAPTAPPNPGKQRASWIHDIAETLAGGPRYSYHVNTNTGTMEKVPVPVSAKNIGLAIALEAVAGATTGLAYGKGAGNMGRGAAAAFSQGEQRVQQQDLLKRQQANEDYARSAQIADTNMRMIRNEQISAQADADLQQRDIDLYAQLFKEAQDSGHIQKMGITPAQAVQMLHDNKLGITKDMLIPYAITQVKNSDGTPVLTSHGVPKYEKVFALIDPQVKLNVDPDLLEKAYKWKIPGFVNPNTGEKLPLSSDLQLRYHQLSGLAEKIRSFELASSAVGGKNQGQEHGLHAETAPTASPTAAPILIKDPELMNINNQAAASHDLNPTLFSAIAMQESSGNKNIKDSTPNKAGVYAIGPYQVTLQTASRFKNPDTGKPYTEAEIRNPKTNAEVAATILSNLINSHKGDVHSALVDYHGAPADVLGVTGEQYAKQIEARLPQGADLTGAPIAKAEPTSPMPQISSLEDELSNGKILPKDIDTLNTLYGIDTLLDGKMNVKDIATLAERQKADPSSVGRLMAWLGPRIDWENEQYLARQESIKGGAAVQKAEDIKNADEARQQRLDAEASQMLKPPTGFEYDPNILNKSVDEARNELRAKGIQIPDNFSDIFAMAKGDSNPTGFTTRTYKGIGGVLGMNQTIAKSFITQFLKQNWKQQDYEAKQKFLTSLVPGQKEGDILYNAGVASQHLDLAQKLFDNIANRQSPVWNEATNWLGKNIVGQSAPAVYDTVATALANEVSKVTTGTSNVTDTSVEHIAENLKKKLSPEQAHANFEALLRLMQPRLSGIHTAAKKWNAVDDYKGYIDPNVIRVFGEHGIEVPGWGQPRFLNGKLIGFHPPDAPPNKMIPYTE